ncbi:MAG: glycosyltransferase family 39 protein [Anaerolineae bacterium]|nr:glycosyltransferase family 39 protein [Anaerolineae bacterium]
MTPKRKNGRIVSSSARLATFPFPRLLILAVILLAAWLRLWRLASIPPGFWFDEGLNGMEAVWLLKTKTWPVFMVQGQGREAMFYYLLALSVSGLGETVYAVRLVPALLGILSIPLMYRWGLSLYKGKPGSGWLALIGAAGLAVSFWYLVMNRVGYRANTLLPVLLFTAYFFWRGWQTGKIRYYFLAGIGLGLCQYTYLAGRLAPLVFMAFVLAQTALAWRSNRARVKNVWLGLVIMGGIAGLIVIPMGLFFMDFPELFWARSGDVALKVAGGGSQAGALVQHLLAAGRVFIDGQDPNWRHHLLGRPVFNWISTAGFWVGLVIAIRHWRWPENVFLLSLLVVMWLPAVLSEASFHTLRLVGVLPAYYGLAAIGWLKIITWLGSRFLKKMSGWQVGAIALATVLLFNGATTFYDYFYRWAKLPEVYRAFDGSVVALAQKLTALEEDVLIPFYLYTHASMRYLLHSHFQETVFAPETAMDRQKNISLLLPDYPEDDGAPPAFVWLSRDSAGSGVAYVSAVAREISLPLSIPAAVIEDDRGNIIARQYRLETKEIAPLFWDKLPAKKAAVMWANNLALVDYAFDPATVSPGHTARLNLAWQILGYTGLAQKMFLQVLDSRGRPAGQQEVDPISRKMYRWRDEGLIFEQHYLPIASAAEPGLYFVRLGFFDPQTGQRLPTQNLDHTSLGDEWIVGPLDVSVKGSAPRSPQQPVRARLGEQFEFLGYSFYPMAAENATEIELYWQARAPGEIDYTVFVQALDAQNQVIAQVDAQPLANIYPTSRWQPGDIIREKFILPIAASELQDRRLVTGMYNLATGARLPVYSEHGDLLPDSVIQLLE